jgi:ornithine cyclodeaminase/alanine dehydrogenase-like protein (mu-crystallin family)
MRILSRRDVFDLLTLRDCIAAVEGAFRLHAEGHTLGPGLLGMPAKTGGFHIKAAGLVGERSYFAAKTNANFPANPTDFGLPTIQGTVVLADATTGVPLALMDSGSVTALRTGAAPSIRSLNSCSSRRIRCWRRRSVTTPSPTTSPTWSWVITACSVPSTPSSSGTS